MINLPAVNNAKQEIEETHDLSNVVSLDERSQVTPAKVDLNLGVILMIEKWKMDILTSDGTSDESNREW